MIDICLYTWPDLYTRLVTYARLHILTLVLSFCHKISYISFISCSWLSYYPSFQFNMLLLLMQLLYTSTFLFTHTHSLGRFWRPWIHMSKILDTFLLFRCSCDRTLREEPEFLFFILVFLPFFIPAIIFLIPVYHP